MDSRRSSYDTVAAAYAAALSSELDAKPLDRALLDALVELAGDGPIADVGAGPGHVAAYLASRGGRAVVLDLSPAMCVIAARSRPAAAADMVTLPIADGCLAAVACLYAVIHLDAAQRRACYAEFARVLAPGGSVLIAFHVSDPDQDPGSEKSLTEWWGEDVDLTFRFLDPHAELVSLSEAGLDYVAHLDRAPNAAAEHPSRRAYLLMRKPSAVSARPYTSA